jgi:phosphoribosyl-dephospho-CoA transferase
MIKRETRIQELMTSGMERNAMLRQVAAEFQVSERTIRKQYESVVRQMQALVKEQRHELRATLMARQEGIFQKAMEKANLKTALQATTEQAKLGGLYDPDVVNDKKTPEVIVFKEKEFSNVTPLQIVPDKVENE